MTNEAAERLREAIQVVAATGMIFPADRVAIEAGLAEALAAERRATVERIRGRFASWPKDEALRDFLSVLNEEAAR